MTCHRIKMQRTVRAEISQKNQSKDFITLGEFGDISQRSKVMQECVRLAKLYALSGKPGLR